MVTICFKIIAIDAKTYIQLVIQIFHNKTRRYKDPLIKLLREFFPYKILLASIVQRSHNSQFKSMDTRSNGQQP